MYMYMYMLILGHLDKGTSELWTPLGQVEMSLLKRCVLIKEVCPH